MVDIETLNQLADEWKELLGLQFWDTHIKICRRDEFEIPNVQGECKWTLSNAQAIIKIIDPIDWPDTPFEYDMEKTLVHELLHLHMAACDDTKKDSMEEIMLERAIEMIAKALVELKRYKG